MKINTQRRMQKTINFLGGKVAPAIFWVALIVAIVHVFVPTLVAVFSDDGEISRLRKEKDAKAIYMPAPQQPNWNVE